MIRSGDSLVKRDMVKHCAICGTLNEEFATSCIICEADLALQITEGRIYGSSAPSAYFSTQSPPEDRPETKGSLLSQLDPIHSLSLLPYVATASMSPQGDYLLGPEEIDLSLQPLAIQTDFETPAYPGTWIGGPAINVETDFPIPKHVLNQPNQVPQTSITQSQPNRHIQVKTKSNLLSPVALLALSSEAPPRVKPPTLESNQVQDAMDALIQDADLLALNHSVEESQESDTTSLAPDLSSIFQTQIGSPRVEIQDAPSSLNQTFTEPAIDLPILHPTHTEPFSQSLQLLRQVNDSVASERSVHSSVSSLSTPPSPTPTPVTKKSPVIPPDLPPKLPEDASSVTSTHLPIERADRNQNLERIESLLKVPIPLDGVEHRSEHQVPSLPSQPQSPPLLSPLVPRSSESFDGFIFQDSSLDDELDMDDIEDLNQAHQEDQVLDPSAQSLSPQPSLFRNLLTWLLLLSLAMTTPVLIDHYIERDSTTNLSLPTIENQIHPTQLKVSFTQVSIARPINHSPASLDYRITAHVQSEQNLKLKPPPKSRIGCISQLNEELVSTPIKALIEIPMGCTLAIELPENQVPFGLSDLKLQWFKQDGSPFDKNTIQIHRPYELSTYQTSADGTRIEIPVKLSPNWKLLSTDNVQQQILYLWAEEVTHSPVYVTFSLISPDQQKVLNIKHPLNIHPSAVSFELLTPSRQHRTTANDMLISGLTLPQATIQINEQKLVSDDIGYFEGLIKLPSTLGKITLPITIKKIAHAPYQTSIEIERISEAQWSKQAKQLKRQLKKRRSRYPQSNYSTLLKGQKTSKNIRLKGEVAWIDRRGDDQKPQHLLLFTCAPAGCPIWVEAFDIAWVHRGDQVELLGRNIEPISREGRGGQLLTAPAVNALYLAPR